MRELLLTRKAQQSLDELKKQPGVVIQLRARIDRLRAEPEARGAKKLSGRPYYRIRVGNYRIIYDFDDELLKVITVGHRSRVYRNL